MQLVSQRHDDFVVNDEPELSKKGERFHGSGDIKCVCDYVQKMEINSRVNLVCVRVSLYVYVSIG